MATHPQWVLGYEDETWWSRLHAPALHAWTSDQPLRLLEHTLASNDPEPKALACYGLLVRQAQQVESLQLRFVVGQPKGAYTIQFLEWVCQRLATQPIQALCLVWDNASWHTSQPVRAWIRTHNQHVKRERQGVRIVVCPLPTKSPWLNPIEPKWVHAKRRVAEADEVLSATVLKERIYATFGCTPEPELVIPKQLP